ncbi:hypothetical protein MGG_18091 [Pyricularia oryzae 70-15]|uniref:Uncharacterized protein n=3 Tax=Pyricularia oryzae TaxID=318829 RepID=G5EGW7_PYRO7|nr:uncharacterized protein MGG_18091 [Pyricularia oryzae 70-15]EAQ70610.1 hypothetical protein MGCH7_ch7g17 [Pyricularia oryzae 70-15]EHA46757.1 hypothetical protein MGG_18091 [Pyricularia oryzae 70-15]ELQ33936.1 hypothetical protein OOU_Y34scaffold00841g6 [Pyricularia oryzae Y34]
MFYYCMRCRMPLLMLTIMDMNGMGLREHCQKQDK